MIPEMGSGRVLAALLFLAAATNAMDVYSATNSSPWTAYNFANKPESVEALWRYVRHAIALTAITSVIAAVVAASWWPVIGAAVAAAYMLWLYADAVKRGRAQGSTGWESPS